MDFLPLAFVGSLGQRVEWTDAAVIGLLVVLEGVLSIDNALVLGLLAKRLPKHQQKRALTYGLVGAFVFRLIAVAMASTLLRWSIVKLLGGGYLVYIAVKHLFFESKEEHEEQLTVDREGNPMLTGAAGKPLSPHEEDLEIAERVPLDLSNASMPVLTEKDAPRLARFWPTVFTIEMTDIAFAVDSILAAMAFIPALPAGSPVGTINPKLWVVYTGGMLGVMLMRVAAAVFIRLLEKFPRFEMSAYLLVTVIGVKLLVDWGFNTPEDPHRINFHDVKHVEFWVFWMTMLACFLVGFLKPRARGAARTANASV